MKILTKESLSKNKHITEEGYLICLNAILGRTGSQTYNREEIFDDGNPNEEIEIMRLPEDVFDERSIVSFENKPITIEHPDTFVNSKNYNSLSVGFVRNVRKSVIDGQEVLIGDLIITDNKAIDVINDGKKYLSCGYDCDIVDQNGKYYQKNIRGNHVALCNNPRAGITMIKDSNNQLMSWDEIKKYIDDEIDSKCHNNNSKLKDSLDVAVNQLKYLTVDNYKNEVKNVIKILTQIKERV